MTHQEPTEENFTEAIREVVAGRGHYIYRPSGESGVCRYAVNGEPSCLIGHVLDRMGFEYDEEWEGRVALGVLRDLGFPRHVAGAAREAQIDQDEGMPWLLALERYEGCLRKYANYLQKYS